jgi:hypothetical protein
MFSASPLRAVSNYTSATWPLVWKFKPHVCLLYSLMGVGFGLLLWLAIPMVTAIDQQLAAGIRGGLGVVLGASLAITLVVWIRATKRTPTLRSIPSDRFSPRFTSIVLGAAAIMGGFMLIVRWFDLTAVYFETIKESKDNWQWLVLLIYWIPLFVIAGAWFSLRAAFACYMVVLVIIIVSSTLSKWGAGYLGIDDNNLDSLIKFSLTLLSLMALLFYLFRGYRTKLTENLTLYLFFAVATFNFPFLGKLDFIRARLFPDAIPPEAFKTIFSYLLALTAIEIVCWLAGKVEALPER